MKCYDSRVLLATRKDLSAAQEQAVRRHIDDCHECRAFWETQERTSRLLRGLPPPPATTVNRVVQAATSRRAGGATSPRPWRRPMLLMGAALGALLIALLGATLRQGSLGVTLGPAVETGSTGGGSVPERAGAEIIAYILRGDVWVKTLPNGEPRRVTNDGRATTPRLSPSGSYVAYLHADNLLVTGIARGETTQIDTRGAATRFAWSPTNDHLAYLTGDGGLRFTLMAIGHTKEVASGGGSIMSGLVASSLAWSPDGRWLAYDLHGVRTEGDNAPALYAGLWRSDGLETHEVYQVEHPEGSGVGGQTVRVAGWSADNQRVLFWQRDSRDPSFSAGGAPLLVTWAKGSTPRELVGAMLPHSDFIDRSPVGHNVAVVEGSGQDTTFGKRITLIDLPSGEALRLTGVEAAALAPAWSPDGSHIAYAAGPDASTSAISRTSPDPLAVQRRIFVMQLNGSEQRQLTTDPRYRDERPRWLAGGQQLLFARVGPTGWPSLWIMNVDGSGLVQIVDELAMPTTAGDGRLAWDESFDLRLPREVNQVRPDGPPATTQPAASPIIATPVSHTLLIGSHVIGSGVGDIRGARVTLFDPSTERESAQIDGGYDSVLAAEGTRIYLAARGGVVATDMRTREELWSLPLQDAPGYMPGGPSMLALSPDGRWLYVRSYKSENGENGSGWLQIVDTASGQRTDATVVLPGCLSPRLISSPLEAELYIACPAKLYVLDTTTHQIAATIATGISGWADGVLSPDGQYLYLTDSILQLAVVDTWQRTVEHVDLPPSEYIFGNSIEVALASNGSQLLIAHNIQEHVGTDNATLFRLLDTRTWQELSHFRYEQPLVTLAFDDQAATIYAAVPMYTPDTAVILPAQTIVALGVADGKVHAIYHRRGEDIQHIQLMPRVAR